MKGERCCFPCSRSGGAALQTRRPPDLSPDEAKLSLAQLLRTPGSPPKPRASGSPHTAFYPKLARGELRLSNSCSVSQDFFLFFRRAQSIPDPKWYCNSEFFSGSLICIVHLHKLNKAICGQCLEINKQIKK